MLAPETAPPKRRSPPAGGRVRSALAGGAGYAGLALALCAALLLAEIALERNITDDARQAARHDLEDHVAMVAGRIERVLTRDLYAVNALATYIATHPDIDQRGFAAYADLLLADTRTVRHLAAAPNMVIGLVHPLAGNESILGFDYRAQSGQREAALRTLSAGETVIAGPLRLIQGGTGLIARAPVVVAGQPAPWGIAAAVLDYEQLLAELGLDEHGYDLAIRGIDALGAAGASFHGDPALFEREADVAVAEVTLPHGAWQLAGRAPPARLAPDSGIIKLLRGATLVAILLVTLLVAELWRRQHRAHAAHRQALAAEQRFRAVIANVNDAVYVTDARTLRVVATNARGLRHLGYRRSELLELSPHDYYADAAVVTRHLDGELAEQGSVVFETVHRHKRGREIPVEISMRRARISGDDLLIAVVRDISERQRALAALRRSENDLTNSLEAIDEGFALWDENDCLRRYNGQLVRLVPGLDGILAPGTAYADFLTRLVDGGFLATTEPRAVWLERHLAAHRAGTTDIEFETAAGRWLRLTENRTPEGHIVGIYQDMTAIRQAQAEIRQRADFDGLTGLPNRDSFNHKLERVLELAGRTEEQVAVLFIDLDRFKNINDTLGHPTGDALLREAAERICASVRQTDYVARFGGDEFTVLLRNVHDSAHIARVAENLLERLAEAYQMDGHALYAGASIGIAISAGRRLDADTLLRHADMAMYQAKNLGRNTYRFFTDELNTRAANFVEIEKDLRRSVGSDEFSLHFQPVVDLRGRRIVSAEALMRWQHPQRGAVSPGEFIPVAEETLLINQLGLWALEDACRTVGAWSSMDLNNCRIAVNVSSRQLFSGFDATLVRRTLALAGLSPERLILELTESSLIEEDRKVSRTLGALRDLGVTIAVDDFGTGYSALSYLRRFPVSVLKIDRSFVRDIENDSDDAHLVESIAAMARVMGITVVAEGVETIGQARMLEDMGCDYAQGYFFGKPVPPAEFVTRYGAAYDYPVPTMKHLAAGA